MSLQTVLLRLGFALCDLGTKRLNLHVTVFLLVVRGGVPLSAFAGAGSPNLSLLPAGGCAQGGSSFREGL